MSGPQCFENPPDLSSSAGAGTVHEISGLKAYVAGPLDSKLAVILIADVFGYEAPNLRKFADKCASTGFLVVVPDFFYGDPIDANNFDKIDRDAWRKLHSTDKGYEDAKKVIAALKSKGVSAIGASGYCWGGVVVAKLASLGELQAAVILHPGKITEDEIKAVRTPAAILGAEIDQSSPPDVLQKYGEILSAKSEFESYVKIFPGVSHGWSMRYKEDDEFAVKSAEEAHQDTLNWFLKHVNHDKATSDLIRCLVLRALQTLLIQAPPLELDTLRKSEDFKTYVASPPDCNIAVLLISDVFGFEAPKLRKFADRVACAGFLVVVPDFFYGDAVDPDNLEKLDRDAWLKSHSPDKGLEDAMRVIVALKSKGVSAAGAVGFFWGGVVLAKLAGLDELQAAVILHPGPISKDEIKAIKIPTAILGAEHDQIFPSAELKKFEELHAAKSEVECYVKIFPGVTHGWSIRYEDDVLTIRSSEEAQQYTLNWLVKYVKSHDKE